MHSENLIKIIVFICRIIDKTLRKTSLNDTFYYPKPSVYSFWHGNQFPMMLSNQKSSIVIMVSCSKDGEILSRILRKFGYLTVRGSSSKGGGRAMIEIIRYARPAGDAVLLLRQMVQEGFIIYLNLELYMPRRKRVCRYYP